MNWSLYLLCLVAVALSVEAAKNDDAARPKREPQVVNGGLVGALRASALAGQRYGYGHYGHLPSYHGHGGHGHGHGFGFGGHHGGHHGGHGHHEHGHGHHHGHH